VVRLTVEEILAVTVLVPILRELQAHYPALRVELDVSDELRDLASGAADVALRSGDPAEGGGLVGRRLADDRWAFYCSRDYAARHGTPSRRRELHGHPIIGGGSAGVWRHYGAWLHEQGLEGAVMLRQGSITSLLASVKGGLGLGILPLLVAEQDPDLVRCLPPTLPGERGLWLLTHERVRHAPRVRVVMDMVGERITRLARSLTA
jgi:DNA-binding transcriptional LysR family regulator